MRIRHATSGDSRELAELCLELGYPARPDDIQRRLKALRAPGVHAVFVAIDEPGTVVGWLHIQARYVLESDPTAEVTGLVVDQGVRGRGVGRALMAAAEDWARIRGLGNMRVRSNVKRAGAHSFYQRIGYTIVKTQHVFSKVLPLKPAEN